MKKIYTLLILLSFLLSFSTSAWAQCEGEATCTITISGTDQYGDGWNGAAITIYQDTIFIGTYSCAGASSVATFHVCQGPVSFSWSSGLYDSECGFTITDSIGATLYTHTSGTTIPTGVFCEDVACATCPRPTLINAFNVTADSATLEWADDEAASGWLYQLSTSRTTLGDWTFTADTNVEFTGLLANTAYYFFLKAICAADDTSAAALHSFRTACGDNPIPFSEGFENNGSNAPFCWSIWEKGSYDDYGYVYEYPQIYYYSYYAHTGSYLVNMYDAYGANSIITPRVLIPANQIEAQFWAAYSSYTDNFGSIQVGYTTTNDSATAVFHLVSVVPLTDAYALYTVDFDTVTTTDSVYVVFRSAGNNMSPSSAINILLDDVTIRQINNCPQVTDFTPIATVSHEITFAWTDTVGTAWEISYGPVGFDPDLSTVRIPASTNPFTLTGLSDSLTYEFYVRTVCGSQRGYWSLPVVARPNTIQMPEFGTDTVYVCGTSISDPGGVSGVVPNYTTSYMVVYPNDSTATIRLTGNINLGSSDYLYIYEGVGVSGRLLGQYSGSVSNINVASSIGPLTLYLSTGYSSYDGFVLTTHCEPLPTCTSPYDVQVSNVTGSSALVSWSYANFTTPQLFTIVATDTANEVTNYYTAADTARSFTITGLSQHTHYLLSVQATCDGGDTSLNADASFFTYCLSGGENVVGTGIANSYYVPVYIYGHAVSQQIFDSVVMAGVDTIFGVRFFNTSNATMTRNMAVYMDSTTRSSYSSYSEIEVQSPANRRFSGPVSIQPGWNEILFDSAFVYSGSGNITLTVDDNTGEYASSINWQASSTTDNMSVYAYSYNGDIDPTDSLSLSSVSTWSTGVVNLRANTVFLTPCGDASCVPPAVVVAATTSSSVTLSWVPGLYEDSWDVEYRQADSTEWNVHASSTSQDTAVISGLQPATHYVFRVTSLCGDTTASIEINATTRCAPVTDYPFAEDFEGFLATYTDPETQICWARSTSYYYSGSYYPYTYSYYHHSGSSCLYMASSSYPGSSYSSMIILPEMGAGIDTLTLSFYMMGDYTAYSTYRTDVGVLANPADTSTFELIASFPFTSDDGEWQFCEANLNGYTGTGRHIAIRTGDGSDSYYLDDILVEYFNPCITPRNPRASNATTSSVLLSFTDTNNAGNYTIVYGTSDDIANATDTIQITTTSTTLSGLATATQYHAWVRVNCPDNQSKWVKFPVFSTLCNPLPVDNLTPYEINFEQGLDSCMNQERISGSTDWEVATTTVNPAGAYSGGYVGQLYNSSRVNETMLILPSFDFTSLDSGAELTFWHAQVQGSHQGRLYVYYRTSPTGDWVVIDSFTTQITAWTQHFVTLPYSGNQAFYQVGLKGVTGGEGVKIDDISVHAAPTCFRPTDLVVDSVADGSATLSWVGSAPSYHVRYRRVGTLSWSNDTTTTNSITLTGLRGLSEYQCMVRGLCSATDNSHYSEMVNFITTACATEYDYFNYDTADFTAYSTYWAPGYCNYNYSYSETLIDSADLVGLDQISGFGFSATSSSTATLNNCDVYFGHTSDSVLNSFKFDSTFVRVYHGSLNFNSAGWHRVILDTPFPYDGHSNLVVAIYRNNSTSDYNYPYFDAHSTVGNKVLSAYYYDPFTPAQANTISPYYKHADTISPNYTFIACAPICHAPTITGTTSSLSSIGLTWIADGNNVQISYKRSSSDTWSDEIDVTGNSYTFTDLDHSTSYDFRLRQDCSADELGQSAWVGVTAVTDYLCPVPTNLQVSDLDNAHATFSWDAADNDTRWEIRVFNNNFNQTYEVSSNPATVNGLQPGTAYHATVRTLCGPDYEFQGAYSSSIDFTTPYCGTVSGVTGEAIGNIAHLRWNPGSSASGYYEIQYGREGYTESEVLGSVISPDTEVYIYNLVPHFTYAFRVRSLCGLSWYSDWSTTPCVITTGDAVGIDQAAPEFSCTLYPNPANGSTTITVSGVEGPVTIEVLDINGRQVASETLNCSANCSKQMEVGGLAQGAYFVRVVTAQSTTLRKLIVQ